MRTSVDMYAPELHQDITVAALSGAGVLAVHNVNESRLPSDAKKMALILEHVRDGMVIPEVKTDKELLEFVEKYPDLTARIFMTVRHLTESLDG